MHSFTVPPVGLLAGHGTRGSSPVALEGILLALAALHLALLLPDVRLGCCLRVHHHLCMPNTGSAQVPTAGCPSPGQSYLQQICWVWVIAFRAASFRHAQTIAVAFRNEGL